MSEEAIKSYKKLLIELLISRRETNDKLDEEIESAFCEKLEDLWWKMTDSEQDDVEALNLVELGTSEQPR